MPSGEPGVIQYTQHTCDNDDTADDGWGKKAKSKDIWTSDSEGKGRGNTLNVALPVKTVGPTILWFGMTTIAYPSGQDKGDIFHE